ncbi:hypothetical protein K3495_g7891 [Podosphaera aphanis]|nr:hypothetical protein K3495_g7891 [Podosphaera aphanis]
MSTRKGGHGRNRSNPRPSAPRAPPAMNIAGAWSVSSVSDAVGGLFRRLATTPLPSSHLTSSAAHRDDPAVDSDTLHRRTATPFQPPPLYPISLHGYNPATPASAKLLTKALAEEIRLLIPARLQLCEQWHLVYSLEEDGVSLGTLYKKCESLRGLRNGVVLVVKDRRGDVFGAYFNEAPRIEPHFFGNGECFLWRAAAITSAQMDLPPRLSADPTTLQPGATLSSPALSPLEPTRSNASAVSEQIRFKAFLYSGVNDYAMLCEAEYLSVGGGDGRYGLWLDDTFEQGISSHCLTFGNEPLSDEGEKFDILGVEVWSIGNLTPTAQPLW